MNIQKSIKIVAMGKYLPNAVHSDHLEAKYGIPTKWILKNSGVSVRHHVTSESSGYMGARAIENALEKCSVELSDIDLIISASATFDYPVPNQSSVIKSHLKEASNLDIATLDVDATCLSFVIGMELAASLLNGVQYKNIVLVSSEISSKGLDPKNWETVSLFGDAAVAAILSYDPTGQSHLIKGGQRTYSEGVGFTIIKGGGNQYHPKDHPYDQELYSFQMTGKKLLKLAKQKIPVFMDWFFADLEMKLTDIDVVIPHQASRLGLAVFQKLYDFKEGQIKENLAQNGNCIAASIPLVLCEQIEQGKINRGDSLMLTGTSAGFSIGGVLLRY